jgi:hypothetical protein
MNTGVPGHQTARNQTPGYPERPKVCVKKRQQTDLTT